MRLSTQFIQKETGKGPAATAAGERRRQGSSSSKDSICADTQSKCSASFCLSSESSKQRKQRRKQQTRFALALAAAFKIFSPACDVLARALAETQSQAGGGGLLAGDLVVSSAGSRSGVGLLRRSDEDGLFYRQLGRGLLQQDISRCCFPGATSFGSGRSAMSAALSAFGMCFLCCKSSY